MVISSLQQLMCLVMLSWREPSIVPGTSVAIALATRVLVTMLDSSSANGVLRR